MLLVGLLSGSVVAEAYAVASSSASDGSCDARGLRTATVEAHLRIDHEDRTYAKASATTTLTVPMSWRPAPHLLLSTGSDRYRRAMRCLARGDHDGVETRWEEWRVKDPAVKPATAPSGEESSHKRWLEVRLSAHAWVAQRGTVAVGPWTVEVSRTRWDVRLTPPDTLGQARWHEVTVDPGRPGARSAEPRATTKEDGGALVWRPSRAQGAPSVEVGIEPVRHAGVARLHVREEPPVREDDRRLRGDRRQEPEVFGREGAAAPIHDPRTGDLPWALRGAWRRQHDPVVGAAP